MPLLPGVGYIMPQGEVTFSGHPIDPTIIITSKTDQNKIRAKLGPDWTHGDGHMHSSDHYAALRKLWERGQSGISTGGVLKNDGVGYDGNPTVNEVIESHRGLRSRTLTQAHTVLPGEPGYNTSPFSPDEHTAPWNTEFWRTAVVEGIFQNLPFEDKELILRQCDMIEAGIVPGWAITKAGKWRRANKDSAVVRIFEAGGLPITPSQAPNPAYSEKVAAILSKFEALLDELRLLK